MPRSTPWGSSQHIESLAPGFTAVSTASHGGMMVSPAAGQKYLSEAARKRALMHGGYFCFEEDCDYLIPIFDSKDLRLQLCGDSPYWKDKSDTELEQSLINDPSVFHPDYLIEVGATPDPKKYTAWKLRQEESAARQARSPELVVSAFHESRSLTIDILQVCTADGAMHYVKKNSYTNARNHPTQSIFLKMEFLEVIPSDALPEIEERFSAYAKSKMKMYSQALDCADTNSTQDDAARRYSSQLSSAKDGLIHLLTEERQMSYEAAQALALCEIRKLKEKIDPMFHCAKIFDGHDAKLIA